ncbi:MAG: CarD family transcriptional regulator [Acidobacteriota bacterium]
MVEGFQRHEEPLWSCKKVSNRVSSSASALDGDVRAFDFLALTRHPKPDSGAPTRGARSRRGRTQHSSDHHHERRPPGSVARFAHRISLSHRSRRRRTPHRFDASGLSRTPGRLRNPESHIEIHLRAGRGLAFRARPDDTGSIATLHLTPTPVSASRRHAASVGRIEAHHAATKGAVHVTFEVGQKVVYPNHGVAVIEDVSEAEFDGMQHNFYHLRLLSNNSKVMIPKENLDLVGLRPLGTAEAINHLFGILEDGNIDTYKDWKGRYKQNLDKMKTGQLTEVAEVLKNLCLVSQKKSLSFREKKMYERAKYFIVSEIAHVRELAEDDAESAVEQALERSLEKMRAEAEEAAAKKSKPKSKTAAKPKAAADKPKSSAKASSSGKTATTKAKKTKSKAETVAAG